MGVKGIFERVKSASYWKERLVTSFMVVGYLVGNAVELALGKVTDDPAIIWILGILIGSLVIFFSISKNETYKSYTSPLFKFFLFYLNFNIIYAYSKSTQVNDDSGEFFYMLFSYILFVVISHALDSRRELLIYTIAEILFFSVAVYLNLEHTPMLLDSMQMFAFGIVIAGNYMINVQRMSYSQISVDSSVQFKVISENARDAQFIMDKNFNFIYLNPAAALLTGYRLSELQKKTIAEITTSDGFARMSALLNKVISEKDSRESLEYQIVNKDGQLIWVESIFSSFAPKENSREIFVFSETRNIEARKELEAEIQQQLRLEEMLIKHSNYFINFERTEIQQGIDSALGEFGKMLNAEGVIVYRTFGKLFDEFRATNHWFAGEQTEMLNWFSPLVMIDQNLMIFLRSLRGEKTAQGNLVEAEELINAGVLRGSDIANKHLYVVPLQSGNVVNGLVIFVFPTLLQQSHLSFFGLIGNMISSAFTRLRTEMILHEAQLTNEFILRALPDWLYIINSKGEFTGSNNYSTLPPYIPDYQLTGKTFQEVLAPETAKLFSDSLHKVIDSDLSVGFEFHDTTIQKGKFLKAIIAPFKANEYLIIVRDITDLKEAQSELESKAQKLEMSNKELEEFAYIVSHDMKQPIRTIISYLTLLRRKHGSQLNEEANEFLNFSIDGANKMSDLIRDILQYSKLEQQISFVTEASLNGVVKKVLENLNDTITTNNAVVTYDQLPQVKGNGTMLTELFQNLIENGIKYNQNEKKTIQIKVKDEGEHWLFAFTDNGIGFEQQYADQIFKIFKRLHNDEEFQGTGIGLSICQKVVEKHGGKIWAISEKGKGSTFYFTLPK